MEHVKAFFGFRKDFKIDVGQLRKENELKIQSFYLHHSFNLQSLKHTSPSKHFHKEYFVKDIDWPARRSILAPA